MGIRRMLVFLLCLALFAGMVPCAVAEEADEFTRAIEYGFVTEEMAANPDSVITWKQFCEMAGRMIEAIDPNALPAWQEMTANAPETPMKRDGGMMSMLFVAKAVNLHTFNADYPSNMPTDNIWDVVTMDYPVFPFNDPIDLGSGVSCVCHVGPSFDYCLRRISLVSGKRLLDWNENGSLRLTDDFTVCEAAQAVLRLFESDFQYYQYLLPDSAALEEYNRAILYGFIPQELLGSDPDQTTVTWSQYCRMIDQMLSMLDIEAAEKWREEAALALKNSESMVREQGCFALYRALDLSGRNGVNVNLANSTNIYGLESLSRREDFVCNAAPFTGTGEAANWPLTTFTETGETYWMAAAQFCYQNISYTTGSPLYNTQIRVNQPLTLRAAALSVVRAFEADPSVSGNILKDWSERFAAEISTYEEPAEVTAMREKILNSETTIVYSNAYVPGETYNGTAYYVSNCGNDAHDGLTPGTAWATLQRVEQADLQYGDAVFFERGGLWRGNLNLSGKGGVTISAYGEGAKPVFTSSPENGASEEKWLLVHEGENGEKIWKFYRDIFECAMIVLDDSMWTWRVLPYWDGSEWLCTDKTTPFDVMNDLTEDLDFFCDAGPMLQGFTYFDDNTHEWPKVLCPVYLRCDAGNPGSVYNSIEFAALGVNPDGLTMNPNTVSLEVGSALDNISIRYFYRGGADNINNGVIQNCEFAWGGGGMQIMEDGYVTGRMGDATYGAWQANYVSRGNYFHDLYSAAMIVEGSIVHGDGGPTRDLVFADNLLVNNHGINLQQDDGGFQNMHITDNIFINTAEDMTIRLSWRSGGTPYPLKFISCMKSGSSTLPYYNNCSITGNSFYYPFQYALMCGIDQSVMPEFGHNIYYLAENSMGLAQWVVNPFGGGFEPVFLDNAESFLREYLKDESSVIVRPGESYVRETRDYAESSEVHVELPVTYKEAEVGSKGDYVKTIQQALIDQGYLSDSADGIFGKKTAAAVKSAQADFGLEQTGIADDAFQKMLYADR